MDHLMWGAKIDPTGMTMKPQAAATAGSGVMEGSGRRDIEFLEDSSTHYNLNLPQESLLRDPLILNIHQ